MSERKKLPANPKTKSIAANEKILNLNPDNIQEAQRILETLKQNSFLESAKTKNKTEEKSLRMLKEAGFFNLNFMNNKKPLSSVNIDKADIHNVFQLINGTDDGQTLKLNDLKAKIGMLNPRVPEVEVPTLTNNKEEISADELYELLDDCDYRDFDPVAEAFRLLDIHNMDAVDMDRLISMMQKFGFKNVSSKDKEMLLECLDMDEDGAIGLEDLRKLIEAKDEE